MEEDVVYIPTNYTDAGKLLGMFYIRNSVEAVVIGVPLALLLIALLPFGIMGNIVGCLIITVPVAGFALLGIRDYSLITFLWIYITWRRNRRVITYRGSIWENKGTKMKSPKGA